MDILRNMTDISEKRREQLRNAASKYRNKNIGIARAKEKIYKINYRAFLRLRQIELFN